MIMHMVNVLSDLLAMLATPLSPPLRALGYLDETLDMRRRSKRNHEAWQPHLENTRRFVLSAAQECADRNRAVILGSGLLLDVPLAELSALFRDVVLMDVVCLPETRKQIKQYPNVRFIEHDATGVAVKLYLLSRSGTSALPEPVSLASAYENASFVVSLNILSQLWVVPRAFIGRHFCAIAPEQVDDWCARIVEAHYSALRKLGCSVCLVGDHEYAKRDREGNIISKGSTVHGLKLPGPAASWTWNIAPVGKGSPYASKELRVGAWRFGKNLQS
jgi:hypothetical protein